MVFKGIIYYVEHKISVKVKVRFEKCLIKIIKTLKIIKKAGEKTKSELHKMKIETANEIGYSNELRKLGKDQARSNSNQKIGQ